MTRITIIDQKSVHIDGYKGIISFSDKEATINCGKRVIGIFGNNLLVASFNGIQMEITGRIYEVKWIE